MVEREGAGCYYVTQRPLDAATGRQTDRQTDRQTGRQAERQTDRQTDRQADKQTDRQADRQTEAAHLKPAVRAQLAALGDLLAVRVKNDKV